MTEGGAVSVSPAAYAAATQSVIDRVVANSVTEVAAAAAMIIDALRDGGVLQAFGTGHSEALAMELVGRAGGLVPTNKISLRDVVLFGDAPREVLHDEKLERDPGDRPPALRRSPRPVRRTCSWSRRTRASTGASSSSRSWSRSTVTGSSRLPRPRTPHG